MVKVGDFTVELVAADTKTPFKEHTAPDGQVYAEVEPDMDYFISLSTDIGKVIKIFVDGVYLGYRANFRRPKMNEYWGKFERKNGKSTITALHFNKTRQEAGATTNNMLTGKVKIEVYRMGEEYSSLAYDCTSASLTADSSLGGKKCIKTTTSGSHSFDINTPKGRTASSKVINYHRGEYLCTITLNYCSALGLIYNKILPPPPALDFDEKMGRKRTISTETSISAAAARSPEGIPHDSYYSFFPSFQSIASGIPSIFSLFTLRRQNDESNEVKKEEPGRKRKRSTEASVQLTDDIVDLSAVSAARVSPEASRQRKISVERTYDFIDLSADSSDERIGGSRKKRRTSPYFGDSNNSIDSPSSSIVNRDRGDKFYAEGGWGSSGSGGHKEDSMTEVESALVAVNSSSYAYTGDFGLKRDPNKNKTGKQKKVSKSVRKPSPYPTTPRFKQNR